MLYPKMSKTRMVFSLDGVWDFQLVTEEVKPSKKLEDSIPMPVPSSYNDIYIGRDFKNHVGSMAYQRTIAITEQMLEKRLVLRFGSATHKAEVFLNGEYIGGHKGGFLPFEFEITKFAKVGENLLTVVVDNIIDNTTLPAGRIVNQTFPNMEPEVHNLPNFDFFNYSGLMRSVHLYTTDKNYIKDIVIFGDDKGNMEWNVLVEGEETLSVQVDILDKGGHCVYQGQGRSGKARITPCELWDTENPYLYRAKVTLRKGQELVDEYTETFGFRTITIEDCRLYLNGKKLYLRGFGKHEDAPISGRGLNLPYHIKDLALMKWMGANSFRTSHYPYSEEMLNLCDQEGILVIAETPAVGLHTGFTATGMIGGEPKGTWTTLKTAEHHKEVIEDMIWRDKNHPCIVMWSVANEPASEEEGAKEYFEPLTTLAKEKDPQHRPVTIVTYEGSSPETCKVAELCDVLVINRYRGWYDTEGNLKGAAALLKDELERFHKRCPEKPIMLGEYGADTIAGMHDIDEGLFSEEYQVAFLKAYSEVFDSLPYTTGEHIWNFADFATAENIKRVQGNKKGIFTRTREPKMSAYYMKQRWNEMKEKENSYE